MPPVASCSATRTSWSPKCPGWMPSSAPGAGAKSLASSIESSPRAGWTTPPSLRSASPEQVRRTSAYVKIADGCDRPCAFCAIPLIKGGFASRPVETILADARRLANEGVREIVMVAQESSAYGSDHGEREGLAALLPQIAAAVPEVPWLRVMYAYPSTVTPKLIETLGFVAANGALHRHAVAACPSRRPASHAPAARHGAYPAHCWPTCGRRCRGWRCARPSSSAIPARPRLSSRRCLIS